MADLVKFVQGSIQLVTNLVCIYQKFERNRNELEVLRRKYTILNDWLRDFRPEHIHTSRFSQENLNMLQGYFDNARQKLEDMNNYALTCRSRPPVIWKIFYFSEKIAGLTAGFAEAEKVLFQLDFQASIRSEALAVRELMGNIAETMISLSSSFREEVMKVYLTMVNRESPELPSDMKSLQIKAIHEAYTTTNHQYSGKIAEPERIVDEETKEEEISERTGRFDIVAKEVRKSYMSSELLQHVDQFVNDILKPWHLDPENDLEIMYEENMFGINSMIEIGVGSTGIVYRAQVRSKFKGNKQQLRNAAVKISHKGLTTADLKLSFLREIEMLAELEHPCIIEFLGAYWPTDQQNGHSALIATELMTCSVASLLSGSMPYEIFEQILLDLAEALEYLHHLGIVHMDIKPENVLLRLENGAVVGRCKLADFGVSCKRKISASQCCKMSTNAIRTTKSYMAPELPKLGVKAQPACDVWSFGILTFHMMKKLYGIQHSAEDEYDTAISQFQNVNLSDISADCSSDLANGRLINLMKCCLNEIYEHRPTMSEVRLELLCIKYSINPELSKIIKGKTMQVLYKEGICATFGVRPYTLDTDIGWGFLCIAADLGCVRSQLALELCFSKHRKIYPSRQIYQQLEAREGSLDNLWLLGFLHEHGIGTEENPAAAVRYFENAVSLGCSFGLNSLGKCYQTGFGVDKDIPEAVRLYQRACDAGGVSSQRSLGQCFQNGVDSVKNISKAAELYKQAADAGYAMAQCDLARCYEDGAGVQKDLSKAVELYKYAACAGYISAQRQLGLCYYHGNGVDKNETLAFDMFSLAANNGDSFARSRLGWCYQHGVGVRKDVVKAVELYKKAANDGDLLAQYSLALCYEHGDGTEINKEEAFKLYEKASNAGDSTAMFHLGRCYEEGIGTGKMRARAAGCYQNAGNSGHGAALCSLGRCHENGIGVERNTKKAVGFYKRAADCGDATAQYILGCCYQNGIEVERNLTEAVTLYEKADRGGDRSASYALGLCYENGVGVRTSMESAISYFQKAAAAGNPGAQHALGGCYLAGSGVLRNASEAFALFQKAADAGHVAATRDLAHCYENGWGTETDHSKAYNLYQQAARAGDATAVECIAGLLSNKIDSENTEAEPQASQQQTPIRKFIHRLLRIVFRRRRDT